MFGLMRFRCSPNSEGDQRRWRMHYCGTCKTIGTRYGQRARLLLNHDAAFLAELLTSLTGADAEQWPRAYRSWNCMRLPSAEEIPPLLRYAAAANILLGEYKVRIMKPIPDGAGGSGFDVGFRPRFGQRKKIWRMSVFPCSRWPRSLTGKPGWRPPWESAWSRSPSPLPG